MITNVTDVLDVWLTLPYIVYMLKLQNKFDAFYGSGDRGALYSQIYGLMFLYEVCDPYPGSNAIMIKGAWSFLSESSFITFVQAFICSMPMLAPLETYAIISSAFFSA
ncbi:hypothetical protein KI387_007151, partial [Taxus chinensis]